MNVQGEQHGASGRKNPLKGNGEAEHYSNPSTSDAQGQQHKCICTATTVDELSYMPWQDGKKLDAEQVVTTGRKSWKTPRHKGGEAVWPPFL